MGLCSVSDDTSDIEIPSIFVSRASYLSLLKSWQDEQDLATDHRKGGNKRKTTTDEGTQTDLEQEDGSSDDFDYDDENEYVGLEVVLSKDEMFAWFVLFALLALLRLNKDLTERALSINRPLMDLLFLLLFLPSLLTLLTVFTQRVRIARQKKAERAPQDAVARLTVFKWGEVEKPDPANTTSSNNQKTTTIGNASDGGDEEMGIGMTTGNDVVEEPTESTALLSSTSSSFSPPSTSSHPHHPLSPSVSSPSRTHLAPSLLSRLWSHLPFTSTSRRPLARTHSTSSLPLRGASPRYPNLTECPICLDPFVALESIVIELPCRHLFHRECALSWLLRQRGCCPVCRRSVMEDDNDDDNDEVEPTVRDDARRDEATVVASSA